MRLVVTTHLWLNCCVNLFMTSWKCGHIYWLTKHTSHPVHIPTISRLETANLTTLPSDRFKLGYCSWSQQISLISYSSLRTELLTTWVNPGCLGSMLSSSKHCLSLWQKGSRKGTSGMSGLTSPLGCYIDYNDLHLLFSAIIPCSLLQYQCWFATLHTVQLGGEITLLYTVCQNH